MSLWPKKRTTKFSSTPSKVNLPPKNKITKRKEKTDKIASVAACDKVKASVYSANLNKVIKIASIAIKKVVKVRMMPTLAKRSASCRSRLKRQQKNHRLK